MPTACRQPRIRRRSGLTRMPLPIRLCASDFVKAFVPSTSGAPPGLPVGAYGGRKEIMDLIDEWITEDMRSPLSRHDVVVVNADTGEELS